MGRILRLVNLASIVRTKVRRSRDVRTGAVESLWKSKFISIKKINSYAIILGYSQLS